MAEGTPASEPPKRRKPPLVRAPEEPLKDLAPVAAALGQEALAGLPTSLRQRLSLPPGRREYAGRGSANGSLVGLGRVAVLPLLWLGRLLETGFPDDLSDAPARLFHVATPMGSGVMSLLWTVEMHARPGARRLSFVVTRRGDGLWLKLGRDAFLEGPAAVRLDGEACVVEMTAVHLRIAKLRLPLPFGIRSRLRETAGEDGLHIETSTTMPLLGTIFAYRLRLEDPS